LLFKEGVIKMRFFSKATINHILPSRTSLATLVSLSALLNPVHAQNAQDDIAKPDISDETGQLIGLMIAGLAIGTLIVCSIKLCIHQPAYHDAVRDYNDYDDEQPSPEPMAYQR